MRLEKMITLEVTDHCNLQCGMCIQAKAQLPHGMPKGFMSFETWKAFIDSLVGLDGPITITPFWVGESLMNPDFLKMMEYAFENNAHNRLFDSITINTNGAMLTKSASERLLRLAGMKNQDESTFMRIHFSIDAIKPETYSKMKGKPLLEVVNQNIRAFIEMREKLGLTFPSVTIALVVTEYNKDEAGAFLEHWKGVLNKFSRDIELAYDWPKTHFDAIYIRRLDDWHDQARAEALHKSVATSLGLVKKERDRIICTNSVLGFENKSVRRPCPGLWRTPIVHRNGDVSVCCFDINMKNVIGNLNETPLSSLWNSELINRWRIAHILGDFSNAAPLCGKCGNLFGPVMSDQNIVEYLEESGKADLIPIYLKRVGPA